MSARQGNAGQWPTEMSRQMDASKHLGGHIENTSALRLIFMGTPQFAVPSLEALAGARAPGRLAPEGVEIVAVVTRQDKPAGRGHGVVFSPVKARALELGLPIWQPGPLRRPENLEELRRLVPDVIVVAAFGQILRREVLELPRFGCLNVHASLLPRHRGASPIAGAILAGDEATGVTIMLMDEGLDTGDILSQRAIPIAPDDTTATLGEKLSKMGAELLLETLSRWMAGTLPRQPQDESQATQTRLLRKEDGSIDWRLPAEVLARQVRAYTPWPGTATIWRGKTLKVLRAAAQETETVRSDEMAGSAGAESHNQRPKSEEAKGSIGQVSLQIVSGSRTLAVRCGQGALRLEVLQLEGKRPLSADEFVRGQPGIVGEVLGTHG
jgi:methionyl-tRNA formyltransferase